MQYFTLYWHKVHNYMLLHLVHNRTIIWYTTIISDVDPDWLYPDPDPQSLMNPYPEPDPDPGR